MTELQIQKLKEYYAGRISKDQFIKEFGAEVNDLQFVKLELQQSIASANEETIEHALSLLWLQENYTDFINELNALLLNPNHTRHQVITKTIQDIASPSSIPFIKKALETNFDYLEYTHSESDAIAKWFSWALYAIGTDEAIAVMEQYATANDMGIRNEMKYRLKKVKSQ